jgi:exonuclease III
LGTDIIFISDLRLKRKDGFDIVKKLVAALLRGTGRKYKLWFNSNLSGRGVGILMAKDLDAVVEDGMEDENQNILALKCKIKNTSFVLVSIYGPNGVCENFFKRLGLFLRDMSPDAKYNNIIVGGDWNTVLDGSAADENIDLHLMKNLPNASQHHKLKLLMEKYRLYDPYRIKHPDSREFTYAPFSTVRKNRSRLDFFLISQNLIRSICDSKILLGTQCRLFDHSAITLHLGPEKLFNNTGKGNLTLLWAAV